LFVQLPANTGLVGFSAHFCRASSLSKAALIMSLNPAAAPPHLVGCSATHLTDFFREVL